MTKELLQEIVTKNKLYVTWKTTSVKINYEQIKQRFKSYEKIVKKILRKHNKDISTKYSQHINCHEKTWKTKTEIKTIPM